MNKLICVEHVVREVLETQPATRDDDFLLVLAVYQKMSCYIPSMSFGAIMTNHKFLGVPPFESIRRSRQKLQHDHKKLRATKPVQDARAKEEETYLEYVRSD